MVKEEEGKPKEKKERWAVSQIATQTAPVIIDTTETDPEKNIFTVEMALVKIMNDLEELKKLV